MNVLIIVTILSTFSVLGYSKKVDKNKIYTLYRDSYGTNLRIHISTFDADQNEQWNKVNCKEAAKLRTNKKHNNNKYWCEKGYYRK